MKINPAQVASRLVALAPKSQLNILTCADNERKTVAQAMESDEFDDDILDEDLIIAASQAHPQFQSTKSTGSSSVQPHLRHHHPGLAGSGNSFNLHQAVSGPESHVIPAG